MLLLGCRTPIYGRITLWKFLCQTTVPEQLNKVRLNLKLKKKIKYNAASMVLNPYSGMRSHFENIYVEQYHLKNWLEPD